MAELPEVETMRRDLERELVGRSIVRTRVAQTRMLGGMAPDEIGTMGGDGDTSPWVWAIAPSA